MRIFLSLLVIFLVSMSIDANAQRRHGTFKDWRVYTLKQHGNKVCYIASSAISKNGNYKKRDEPYLLVTNVNKKTDEVSTSSGYPYKTDSEVKISIDNKKNFKFFTKGELAWAHTKEEDRKIVKELIKGLKVTVRGTSKKGTYSKDTYSLKGFSKAYRKMKTLCAG